LLESSLRRYRPLHMGLIYVHYKNQIRIMKRRSQFDRIGREYPTVRLRKRRRYGRRIASDREVETGRHRHRRKEERAVAIEGTEFSGMLTASKRLQRDTGKRAVDLELDGLRSLFLTWYLICCRHSRQPFESNRGGQMIKILIADDHGIIGKGLNRSFRGLRI